MAVVGIVVSAGGGVVYTWSCCDWSVWGKVTVLGIVVAAAGGVVVYLEWLWTCGWPVWGRVPVQLLCLLLG